MPAEYLPEVAWETIVKDVQVVDATHYYVSVYPENPNDPGADLMAVTVGSYLKDWIGHTFKVVEVNIGGIPLRLRVEDSFSVGTGPQQGLTGIVYKSPTGSPFLAPIRHFRLDESALDYSRAIELDVLWRNLLHLDQTTHQTVYGGQPTFDEGLKLGLTPILSNAAGELYYDETWKCLSINNGDGTVSQIPQEEHIYVYNNSASNILEGQAVYDTGSGTNGTGPTTTTVALAKADKISTSNVIGVATNNIPIGSYGKITIRGKINNINTSSFGVAGNTLYLSTTTAGLLTTTKPTAPNLVVRVGKLYVSSATVGSIEVSAISWRDMLEVAIADIVDNLTSTAADKPLSANQGRVLAELIAATASASKAIKLAVGFSVSTEAVSYFPSAATVTKLTWNAADIATVQVSVAGGAFSPITSGAALNLAVAAGAPMQIKITYAASKTIGSILLEGTYS